MTTTHPQVHNYYDDRLPTYTPTITTTTTTTQPQVLNLAPQKGRNFRKIRNFGLAAAGKQPAENARDIEEYNIEEGLMSPRALSGAAALAISEAAAL